MWGFGVSDPTNAVRRLHEQCPRVRLDEMDVDQLDFVFVFHDRRQPDGPRRRRAVTLQFPNVLVYDRTAITTDAIQQELYAHGFYHDTRHAAVPHDLFA